MRVRNLFTAFVLTTLLISCGTGMKIPSEKILNIDSEFRGSFSNISHKVTTKNGIEKNSDILTLLNIVNNKSDSISVRFSSKNELAVTYNGILGKSTEYFKGKFSKRGYFEIYLKKKNIQIPPLFPIIYSKTDINRLRINLTKENTLIIDKYFSRGGNIFLLAAGGSGRFQYYFNRFE